MEANESLSHPDAKSIEGSLLCQEKERRSWPEFINH